MQDSSTSTVKKQVYQCKTQVNRYLYSEEESLPVQDSSTSTMKKGVYQCKTQVNQLTLQ